MLTTQSIHARSFSLIPPYVKTDTAGNRRSGIRQATDGQYYDPWGTPIQSQSMAITTTTCPIPTLRTLVLVHTLGHRSDRLVLGKDQCGAQRHRFQRVRRRDFVAVIVATIRRAVASAVLSGQRLAMQSDALRTAHATAICDSANLFRLQSAIANLKSKISSRV